MSRACVQGDTRARTTTALATVSIMEWVVPSRAVGERRVGRKVTCSENVYSNWNIEVRYLPHPPTHTIPL